MSQGIEVAANPLAVFQQLPEADDLRERRRDWVRAAYIGLLAVLFASVIVFACCANQFGDWVKAKELLTIILPALTGLIGAGTAFYFKNPGN